MEVEGAYLFFGKGKCVVCHSGPYLSNFQFMQLAFHSLVSDETDSVLITEDIMQRTTLQICTSSAYPSLECR